MSLSSLSVIIKDEMWFSLFGICSKYVICLFFSGLFEVNFGTSTF